MMVGLGKFYDFVLPRYRAQRGACVCVYHTYVSRLI